MEARGAAVPSPRTPAWLLGAAPLALIAAAIAAFALLGAPGLGDRNGPPVEDLAVERTVLRPGEIELTVRNDGPDAARIAQVSVNDAYVDFEATSEEVGRLAATTITVPYDWIEGEAYEIFLLTSTGGTVEHAIDVAAETPEADGGFYGLMVLLGIYVGVIPVSLGMLWLPFVRRIDPRWVRFLLALTVGLLAFLAIDAVQEGVEVAAAGPQAFGGAALVFVGALAAYLLLAGIDAGMAARRERAAERGAGMAGAQLALLIAVGIGLHNLGEGLAIGSAYAVGALALGAFLVVGFAVHNTTEGLAVVAPLSAERPGIGRLAALGLVAGAPAILGAAIGAAAFDASLAAFLLGAGAGAIAQVVQQILPSVRDEAGRALHPLAVAGMLAGLGLMFATGLLVSV
jgi:zinc transporter, ZIP family